MLVLARGALSPMAPHRAAARPMASLATASLRALMQQQPHTHYRPHLPQPRLQLHTLASGLSLRHLRHSPALACSVGIASGTARVRTGSVGLRLSAMRCLSLTPAVALLAPGAVSSCTSESGRSRNNVAMPLSAVRCLSLRCAADVRRRRRRMRISAAAFALVAVTATATALSVSSAEQHDHNRSHSLAHDGSDEGSDVDVNAGVESIVRVGDGLMWRMARWAVATRDALASLSGLGIAATQAKKGAPSGIHSDAPPAEGALCELLATTTAAS